MPAGEQPTAPPSNYSVKENTSGLKVYYKTGISSEFSWARDYSLVCLGHSKTKGSKIGSAQFTMLYFNNDSTSTNWQEADLSMRFNAAVKYRVDMSDGYKTPYLVKVTDVIDGYETAVWYGYISSVDQDFVNERVSVSALTYEGLLDQQAIFGGWYYNINGTVDFYPNHSPIYNPKGIGNKSGTRRNPLTSGYDTWGIDETLVKETSTDSNRWTTGNMIEQVWSRCAGQLYATGDPSELTNFNPYKWVLELYRTIDSLDWSQVENTLVNSSPVNNYSLQGKTIWEALVELVESIDGLTISNEIDTTQSRKDGEPYLSIVNLKG